MTTYRRLYLLQSDGRHAATYLKHASAARLEKRRMCGNEAAVHLELLVLADDGEVGELLVVQVVSGGVAEFLARAYSRHAGLMVGL